MHKMRLKNFEIIQIFKTFFLENFRNFENVGARNWWNDLETISEL